MRLSTLMVGLAAGARCYGCGASASLLCDACADAVPEGGPDPPIGGVDRTCARWAYEGIPRDLILDLKIRGARSCASALARGMTRAARAHGVTGSVITWVPGRPADIRRRGFDHAGLLARETAKTMGLPYAALLIRRSDTADQTLLSARDRKNNLKGAFEAEPSPSRVIVIDDLVTTGATGVASAQALRAKGARVVELLVACRA